MSDDKLKAHLRRILNRNGLALDAVRKSGKWTCEFANLTVKPAELTALFKAAGIKPGGER